jgi:DNA-binding response OmpR family regulator
MRVLIVEDEQTLCESMVSCLKQENYLCDWAGSYDTARDKIYNYDYDCILLDITLPGGSGLEILKQLKDEEKMDGVLIISAKNSLEDKVRGLQLGADDYLAKPFHLSEMVARVKAIIRRRSFGGSNVLHLNELVIDTMGQTVRVHNRILDLTRKEYQLLLYFVNNKGRVISKNAIAGHLWGDEMEDSSNYDFIYTHVKNLRRKLIESGTPDYIQSVYGMGYKFAVT